MKDLLAAIVDNNTTKVKALLKADPHLATQHIDEAKLYEAGIFHWIYVGDTALHLAAAGYRVEIVQLLLAAGTDVNSVANRRLSSPLHYAADGYITGPAWDPKEQVRTIRCLLDAGADLHAQDKNGATPLHRAVRTRCAAAVQALLSAGADPKSRNLSGSTPFHLAVQNTGRGGSGEQMAKDAQRKIIETFLTWGVSTKLTDGSGKSVVDCAKSGWIREMLSAHYLESMSQRSLVPMRTLIAEAKFFVSIVRYVEPHQPGIVECRFTDVWGQEHTFIDKLPYFSTANLDEASTYPQPGAMPCAIERRWHDPAGREIVTVNTAKPLQIESTAGCTQFDLLLSEVDDLTIGSKLGHDLPSAYS